jgi:hypothetical protein
MRLCAAVFLVALAFFGCMPARRAAAPPPVYLTATPEGLLGAYNANASRIPTLSAQLTLLFYQGDNRVPHRESAWLDVEKPDRISLRHDALGSELFNIVSDGTHFWIGLDHAIAGREDVVYTGELAGLKHESFLRPDRLLAAFSLAPLPPVGAADSILESYNDRYVLDFVDDSRPKRILSKASFSRADLKLSRYQVFDEQSRLVLDIEYRSYMAIGDAYVPDTVFITWPLDRFAVQAKARDVKIGAPIPARRWVFRWRPDAEVVDITKSTEETPERQEP